MTSPRTRTAPALRRAIGRSRGSEPGAPRPAHDLLGLQRAAGNRAVAAAVSSLRVSSPDDPLEQEAARVAGDLAREPRAQPAPRAPVPPGPAGTPSLIPGGGAPLAPTVRAALEPKLGHGLGGVRVHTDEAAAEAAARVEAAAFTVGSNIYFGSGRYDPGSAEGRELLAHEVTHVVQQEGDAPQLQRQAARPRVLAAREPHELSFPDAEEPEADMDRTIVRRQTESLGRNKGNRLGAVSFKGLPELTPATKGRPDAGAGDAGDAAILRRAAKWALLDIISGSPDDWSDRELHVRVPIDPAPVATDFAMVALRFDRERNAEVELVGVDRQEKGSITDVSSGLESLQKRFEIAMLTDAAPKKFPGDKAAAPVKAWSSNDIHLLSQALPLLGATELAKLKGVKFRRLAEAQHTFANVTAAGFYFAGDDSISLTDSALPISRDIWFGGPQRFLSFGVFTVLHEIGHAVDEKAAGKKGPTLQARFKAAVEAESKRITKKPAGAKFPPPGITLPTAYSAKSWREFYADSYAIFRTSPEFLDSPTHRYLLEFFRTELGDRTPADAEGGEER